VPDHNKNYDYVGDHEELETARSYYDEEQDNKLIQSAIKCVVINRYKHNPIYS